MRTYLATLYPIRMYVGLFCTRSSIYFYTVIQLLILHSIYIYVCMYMIHVIKPKLSKYKIILRVGLLCFSHIYV